MRKRIVLGSMAMVFCMAISLEGMAFETIGTGAQGDHVAEVQSALIRLGYLSGNVDLDAAVDAAEAQRNAAQEEEAEEAEPAETAESEEISSVSSAEISQEFKDAMDSYEAFFDEYAALMKKAEENPDDLGLLMELTSYLGKYTDTMNKFEALENSDMNDAEMAYYIEVQARIYQKLLLEM